MLSRLFKFWGLLAFLWTTVPLIECDAEIVYVFNDTLAYASSKPWSSSYDRLSLDISTKLANGVVFFLEGTGGFLQLTMQQGTFILAAKIREQFNSSTSDRSIGYHDGRRHSLTLMRRQEGLKLSVDRQAVLELAVSEVWSPQWTSLYIGGLPNVALTDGRIRQEPRFKGCVSNLMFGKRDSQTLEPVMFVSTRAVRETSACPLCVYDVETCGHDGRCAEDGLQPCRCKATGYSGPQCQTESPVASFDGQSCLHFTVEQGSPMQIVNYYTVRFRTAQMSGTLLKTGDLSLRLKVGRGNQPSVQVQFSDSAAEDMWVNLRERDIEWHSLEVQINSSGAFVEIDRAYSWPVKSTKRGLLTDIWIGCEDAKVGGSPPSQGFSGCLQHMYIGDLDLISAREDEQLRLDNLIDINEFGQITDTCIPAADADRSGHSVHFQPAVPSSMGNVFWPIKRQWKKYMSFWFRTSESDALLLASNGDGQFAVYISCGFLKLEYSLAGVSEHSILHHNRAVDDGKWHHVHIHRRPFCRLQLSVDSHVTRDNAPPVLPESCQHVSWDNLAVGGASSPQRNGKMPLLTSIPDLRGCMGTFRFDSFSLMKSLYSSVQSSLQNVADKPRNIQLNCQPEKPVCRSSPCQHGGNCLIRSDTFECDCQNTNYTGRQCSKTPLTATFVKGSMWKFTDLPLRCEERCEKHHVITFQFRTRHLDGVLFSGSLSTNHTIALHLANGRLQLSVDSTVQTMEMAVFMDTWYTVHLAIRRHIAELKINNETREVRLPALRESQTHCLTKQFELGGSTALPTVDYFAGCMRLFRLSGRDLFEEKFGHSSTQQHKDTLSVSRNGCLEAMLDCLAKDKTYTVYTMPVLPDNQLAGSPFQYLLPNRSSVVTFRFSTDEMFGTLAAVHGNGASLFVFLNGGLLCMVIGQSLETATHRNCSAYIDIANGLQHILKLALEEDHIEVTINLRKSPSAKNSNKTEKIHAHFDASTFFGHSIHIGHSQCSGSSVNFQHPGEVRFAGCISHLHISGRCYHDPLESSICPRVTIGSLPNLQVMQGCQHKYCSREIQRCHHKTKCIDALARSKCDCYQSGYTGKSCEIPATAITLPSNSHFHMDLPKEVDISSIFFRWKMPASTGQLQTTDLTAVLALFDKSMTSGLWIHLTEGRKRVRATLQLQSAHQRKAEASSELPVFDRYHQIELKLSQQHINLSVDNDIVSFPNKDHLKVHHLQLGQFAPTHLIPPSSSFHGWIKELYVNKWRPIDVFANTSFHDQQLHKIHELNFNVSAQIGEHPLDCQPGDKHCVTTELYTTTSVTPHTTHCSPNDIDCQPIDVLPCGPNEPCPGKSSSSGSTAGVGIVAAVTVAVVLILCIIVFLVAKFAYRHTGEYSLRVSSSQEKKPLPATRYSSSEFPA